MVPEIHADRQRFFGLQLDFNECVKVDVSILYFLRATRFLIIFGDGVYLEREKKVFLIKPPYT